jgi:mycothiol synthase
MPSLSRVEVHDRLDDALLAEVLGLVETAAAAEGYDLLGEQKHAQLTRAPGGWSGVLAYDGSGRLAGYAHVGWGVPGGRPQAVAELVTEAGREAVGGRLLDAVEGIVADSGGGPLWVWCHHVRNPGATLPARRGYRVQRRLAFMRTALERRPATALPPGVVVRHYAGGSDDAEFLRVNNAAFAGHPENGGWTPDVFEARRRLPWFDPLGLLLAWRGDRLLGFHWTKRHEEALGEVYVLAVHPDAQGTGLGRGLLEAGLAHLYDRGCRTVVLYVDRGTPGAVALYEAAGFTTVHDEVCYERDLARRVAGADGGAGAR